MTEDEIRELENQLSCPSGKKGIEVGENLNESNFDMTLSTIHFLELIDNNLVLELGHGNCRHLEKLLESAKDIKYYGLEISKTMWEEAQKINPNLQADFKIYDGEKIPFPNDFFDKIMSVNTIYFWSNPKVLINEIERTLKPNGVCVLTYANKEFMKKLPFVRSKFKLFDEKSIEKLIELSNLKIIEFKDITKQVKSKVGELVERKYTMVKVKKQ
ncbi:MAG: class I SAM-dependent methyltransferase [Moheibacter sp.]